MLGAVVLEEKWPVLGRHNRAAEWLRIWVDLGRAPRPVDAYARGLAEYLEVCERDGVDPIAASNGASADPDVTTMTEQFFGNKPIPGYTVFRVGPP